MKIYLDSQSYPSKRGKYCKRYMGLVTNNLSLIYAYIKVLKESIIVENLDNDIL